LIDVPVGGLTPVSLRSPTFCRRARRSPARAVLRASSSYA